MLVLATKGQAIAVVELLGQVVVAELLRHAVKVITEPIRRAVRAVVERLRTLKITVG